MPTLPRFFGPKLWAFVLPLLLFLGASWQLNRHAIWFANSDQDLTLVVEALRNNDRAEPYYRDHPALGVWPLYSNLYRLYDGLGFVPISRFNELRESEDPVRFFPNLYEWGRNSSALIAAAVTILVASSVMVAGASFWSAWLTLLLCLSSYGLFLHSLILRSELSTSFYFFAGWLCWVLMKKELRRESPRETRAFVYAWLTGILFAWSVMTKIVVLPLLCLYVMSYDWRDRRVPDARARKVFYLLTGASQLFIWSILISINRTQSMAPQVFAFAALGALGLLLGCAIKRWMWPLMTWTLVVNGFLGGILLLFKVAHVKDMRASLLDFLFRLSPMGQDDLTATMRGAETSILGQFLRFAEQHTLVFFHLAVLVGVLLWQRKKISWQFLLFLGSGLGMDLVNSLRWYWEPYLIFSQVFFSLAIAWLLKDWLAELSRPLWQKFLVCLGLPLFFVVPLLSHAPARYADFNDFGKDDLRAYWGGMITHPDYAAMMKRAYPTQASFMRRVLCDDSLNGKNRGIDPSSLRKIPTYVKEAEVELGHPLCAP